MMTEPDSQSETCTRRTASAHRHIPVAVRFARLRLQRSLLQFAAPSGILVWVCHTFAATYAFAVLHASRPVCDLEYARARDMVVASLDGGHNLGQIACREPLRRVHLEESGLQIIWCEVAIWTAVRVLCTWLVRHQDLLAAERLSVRTRINANKSANLFAG